MNCKKQCNCYLTLWNNSGIKLDEETESLGLLLMSHTTANIENEVPILLAPGKDIP